MKFSTTLILLITLSLLACKQNPVDNFKQLDLLSYGIPISIKTPEGATVESNDLGVMKDISVKAGDDYFVQIYAGEATTIKVSEVLADQMQEVKKGPFFSKIVEEHEEGFIFEKKIDSTKVSYDFKLVKIMGDQEYIYQTGLFGRFTEDQVRVMYQSVK